MLCACCISCLAARIAVCAAWLTRLRHLHTTPHHQGAVDACKMGSTIALRYAVARPQFGDKLIGDYLTHQRRLLPGLAATYALHLGLKHLKVRAQQGQGRVRAAPRRRGQQAGQAGQAGRRCSGRSSHSRVPAACAARRWPSPPSPTTSWCT